MAALLGIQLPLSNVNFVLLPSTALETMFRLGLAHLVALRLQEQIRLHFVCHRFSLLSLQICLSKDQSSKKFNP